MDEKTLDQIQEDVKAKFVKGNADDPVVVSCIKQYSEDVEADKETFDQIDVCRKFGEKMLIKTLESSAFGKSTTLAEKYGDAMRHPEGSPYSAGMVNRDGLVVTEATTKYALRRMKTSQSWSRAILPFFTDGTQIRRVEPEQKGFPKSAWIDRKAIVFEAKCEDIHHEDPAKASKWAHELEVLPYMDAIEKHPEYADRINLGMPSIDATNADETQSQRSQDKIDEMTKAGKVGILYIKCLSSPANWTVKLANKEEVKIKKGEPFFLKIAGGACGTISCLAGDKYPYWWPKTKNKPKTPYLNYVAYKTSKISQGLRVQSPMAKTLALFADMEEMVALMKKNRKLAFDPIHLIKFSGKKSQQAHNFFRYQLSKAKKGEKYSNYYTVSGNDIDVSKDTLTPETLDPTRVREEMRAIEADLAANLNVILDDTINQKDEKVGIRNAREIAENSSTSRFQDTNAPVFMMEQNMVLAQLMEFTPKVSTEGEEMVDIKGGIDNFVYQRPLKDLLAELTPECLEYEWKFAATQPKGGLQAAAQIQNNQILMEGLKVYPQNRQIRKAHLSNLGAIVNSVNGTESFDTEAAIAEDEAQLGQAEQEQEQAQAQEQAQQQAALQQQLMQQAAPA